jgi:PmbA protein
MNKEMQDLTEWTIKTAKTAGANDCKVSINNDRNVEISYRQRKPETIKEATTKQLYIQVFVNGRYSSQTTSDLRKDPLKEFIDNAVRTTKLLAEDPYRTLPETKYYQGRKEMDLGQVDPTYTQFTPENRHDIVKTIENTILEKGGDKVVTTTAFGQDGYSESVTMTSNGFSGYTEGTFFVAGAEMTVQDEGDRRPNGSNYAVTLNRKDMPSPAKIGEVCVQRTMSLLGAKKIKTETLPIIIENRGVGRVFGGFLQAMNGRSIQQRQSFLADKKGEKVGSDRFTLVDDPFVKGGLGSRLFDGDGFAAKKRIMIDKGVLNEYYVDWYYSRKLDWEPTTGGPSNLIVPPGKRSVEEIMKDLGRGIYITGFIGGNSNPTTGDASVGIIGQLFEGGKPVQAISEMNISDNHLKLWHKLVEVANDPYPYSSLRFPSMVFQDIVVSGL